jgi:hypothetical protein
MRPSGQVISAQASGSERKTIERPESKPIETSGCDWVRVLTE